MKKIRILHQLNIRTKLILLGTIGTIALAYIIYLAISISELGLNSVDKVYQDSRQVQKIQRDFIGPIFYLRELSSSLVTAPNEDFRAEINDDIEPLVKTLNSRFNIISPIVNKEWKIYKNLLHVTQKFINEGFEEGAFLNVNTEERKQFYKLVETLKEIQNKELIKSSDTFESAKSNILQNRFFIILISSLLSILILLLNGFIIAKISKAIEEVKAGHSRFFDFLKYKDNHETIGITLDTNDELGDMARTINAQMEEAKASLKKDRELIEDATEMLEELKEGSLEKRLHVIASSTELNTLKEVINAMVDSLESKIIQEIDQRTSQEKLLIQQSKLASMGNMIGNIAHQWRQPLNELNAILMNMETKYKFNDFDETFIQQSVKECNEITSYMSNTISDFQNFFKPSKTKEFFNVVQACKKAGAILHSSLKHHTIDFQCTFDKEKEVYGYPNEFSQAFLNILSNAKDVLIQRNIENPYINVNIKSGKNYILIQVKDNGGGIKKEYLERIFEPYFTTKHAKQGTGIGLYMSKTIIENNMDGFLNAINTSDGVCFTIKLK